jgi:hypothetical protein
MADTTTDHDTIRQWAEAKGGKPAAVERTHSDDDVGIIRIMFPDAPNSQHDALVEISWDAFFEEFEARQLALLYDEKSLFSKIIGRDTAEKRQGGDHAASRHADRGSDKGGGQARSGPQENGGKGGRDSAGQSGGDADYSLKDREYRDADGTVRHHTKTYMKEHGGG